MSLQSERQGCDANADQTYVRLSLGKEDKTVAHTTADHRILMYLSNQAEYKIAYESFFSRLATASEAQQSRQTQQRHCRGLGYFIESHFAEAYVVILGAAPVVIAECR